MQIVNPIVELSYPIEDNELRLVLTNPGKGTVNVSEIFLDVEKWEPVVDVDYSVPAAPLEVLYLEVQLSIDKNEYSLLKLNDEPERVYSAEGSGAEKIVINASSKYNAVYWVRLRIPYFDLTTGQKETIYYPRLGEQALSLRYEYAPGWTRDIEPQNLLDRSKVYENIATKFNQILIVLQNCYDLDNRNKDKICEDLDKILGTSSMYQKTLRSFFGKFISSFVSIAILEKRQDMIPTILRLIIYYGELLREGSDPLQINVEELAQLTGNTGLQPTLEKFVRGSFSEQQQIFKEILSNRKAIR